jgi:hypothetical protein
MIGEERKNVSGEFRGKFGETQTVHFNGRPWTSANSPAHHAMSDQIARRVSPKKRRNSEYRSA